MLTRIELCMRRVPKLVITRDTKSLKNCYPALPAMNHLANVTRINCTRHAMHQYISFADFIVIKKIAAVSRES